jgi:hypothetical protein
LNESVCLAKSSRKLRLSIAKHKMRKVERDFVSVQIDMYTIKNLTYIADYFVVGSKWIHKEKVLYFQCYVMCSAESHLGNKK